MNSRDERILHRIKTFKEEKRHKSHQQLKNDITPTLLDAVEILMAACPELDKFKKEIIGNIQSLDIVKLKRDYEAMKLCCSHQAEEIARLKEIEKNFNNNKNTDIAYMKQKLDEYQHRLEEQQQVIVKYDAGSKQQSMQLQASSNYISALEERCNDLTSERDTLKQQCESFHKRIIELENKLGRYTANLAQLRMNEEITSSQLDKDNNMILQLEKQLAQAQIEAEKYRKIREILK